MPGLRFDLPASFALHRIEVAGVIVVAVEGELDLLTSDALREALDEHEDRTVLVDLCGCTFMDCSGLQTLLGALHRAEEAGERLAVACAPWSPGGRLLRLTVHDRFETFESRAAAFAALGIASTRSPGGQGSRESRRADSNR